jgi:hypothetical protein
MEAKHGVEMTLAERKAQLVRQGEYYRVGIVHAKAQVAQGARPDVLWHSAMDHAGWALRSRVDSLLHPTGANLTMLMPVAMGALRFLARRHLVKPVAGVAAGVGALVWYLKHRRAHPSP